MRRPARMTVRPGSVSIDSSTYGRESRRPTAGSEIRSDVVCSARLVSIRHSGLMCMYTLMESILFRPRAEFARVFIFLDRKDFIIFGDSYTASLTIARFTLSDRMTDMRAFLTHFMMGIVLLLCRKSF